MNPASTAIDLLQPDPAPKARSSAKGGDFAATFERELRDQTRPPAREAARKPDPDTAGRPAPAEADSAQAADPGREPGEAAAAEEAAAEGAEGGNGLPLLADAGGLFVDWAALLSGPSVTQGPPPLDARLAHPVTSAWQGGAHGDAEAKPGPRAPNGARSGGEVGERLFGAIAERAGGDGKPATDVAQLRTGAGESTPRFTELLRVPTAGVTGPAVAAPAGAPATTTATASLPAVAVPMQPNNQPAWNQAFSERVVWMARGGIQEAQLQLNPRHLGPVEVRLSVQQDQVNVQFTAQHATTREAIEQALPRLRDLLGDSGLQLGQADVGDTARRQETGGQSADGRRSAPGGGAAGEAGGGELHEAAIAVAEDGTVDYYA
jgi:flagellar hook-length control protein FliK